jgi:exopolysaccharide biosynthesis polyprenyl glycosylphosphotransferase
MANPTNSIAAEAPRPLETSGRARATNPAVGAEPGPAAAALDCEVLGTQQFMRQLHIEKRRADRVVSPLSLVIVDVDHPGEDVEGVAQELLALFYRSKRETDILGYLAKDRIGILLPHTDKHGAQSFVNSLLKRAAGYPIRVKFATYPDQLLEILAGEAKDTHEIQDTISLLFDERADLSPWAAATKRIVDVVGALFGILLFSPVMLAIAVAVKLSSPGPIIFRQTRLGKGAKPFVFYKFRSMYANADDRIHREYVANLIEGNLEKINQGDSERPVYKMMSDPRITKVGHLLRKTSLDELPQFFNVLKGDMSLVGPRPPLPYEAEKYQSWHLRRILQIRPGITGLWQVEGRSTTSFDEMVRLDLRYIRQCSLWLDLKILLKTLAVVIRRDGAG